MGGRVSRVIYPDSKKSYASLIFAILLMAGFAVLFYVNMFSKDKNPVEKKDEGLDSSVEQLIKEEAENGKQVKAKATVNERTEQFTFYKTLTRNLRKPTFDPASELVRKKTKPKLALEDLDSKSRSEGEKSKPSSSISENLKGGLYFVQMSSFSSFERADNFLKLMRKKGYNPFIVASKTDQDKTLFRVRMGKFKDINEAKEVSGKLNVKENLKSIVVKELGKSGGL